MHCTVLQLGGASFVLANKRILANKRRIYGIPYSPLPPCETFREYAYYVRLVTDPKRKSKYIVRHWHGVGQVYTNCDELKQMLLFLMT